MVIVACLVGKSGLPAPAPDSAAAPAAAAPRGLHSAAAPAASTPAAPAGSILKGRWGWGGPGGRGQVSYRWGPKCIEALAFKATRATLNGEKNKLQTLKPG